MPLTSQACTCPMCPFDPCLFKVTTVKLHSWHFESSKSCTFYFHQLCLWKFINLIFFIFHSVHQQKTPKNWIRKLPFWKKIIHYLENNLAILVTSTHLPKIPTQQPTKIHKLLQLETGIRPFVRPPKGWEKGRNARLFVVVDGGIRMFLEEIEQINTNTK